MKKKFLFLALALAALISAFAIGAIAAEEEPILKIEAANLEFADSVYLWYAVSHEGIDANDIRILFFTEPQSEYTADNADYYASCYTDGEAVAGKADCAIFRNTALRAKNMADDIYAVAYAVADGEEYYSAPVKYSILQYAYNKLGKTGTASDNEALKDALAAMLEYGAAVQLYTDYKSDRLANADFYQVKADGGTLSDGFSKGLYLAGQSISLSAPAEKDGKAFYAWQNSAGEAVALTAEATVTVSAKNEVYTAAYGKPIVYSQGLAFTSLGNGTCSVSGIGDCKDTDLLIPPTSPDGDTVKIIGRDAFRECEGIVSVTVPDTVTTIWDGAFAYCQNLTSVYIPDSVTAIHTMVFYRCENLVSVRLSNSIEKIASVAFVGCQSLTDIVIPDSVTSIGEQTFFDSDLTSIILPGSVTSVGSRAFESCDKLATVYYKGTKTDWDAITIGASNESLTNATRYYYNESEPTAEGNYWHYGENGEIEIWE